MIKGLKDIYRNIIISRGQYELGESLPWRETKKLSNTQHEEQLKSFERSKIMNEENTLKLTSSFPNLYPKLHPSYPAPRERPFFFECRDGWFQLLWDLSEKLEDEIVKSDNKIKIPLIRQVKEKFGTLRFYVSSDTDTIRTAIQEAERISSITCEICGEAGILRNGDWLRTLCQEHNTI